MTAKTKFASDAFQDAYDCYISNDPEEVASYEAELADAELAQKLYNLRAKAGLTRRPLVKLVGTTASVI
jgi:hypothetical protein